MGGVGLGRKDVDIGYLVEKFVLGLLGYMEWGGRDVRVRLIRLWWIGIEWLRGIG